MLAFGVSMTTEPKVGDVALVTAPCKRTEGRIIYGPVGAICVDDTNYATLTRDLGLVVAPLPLVRAWRIE